MNGRIFILISLIKKKKKQKQKERSIVWSGADWTGRRVRQRRTACRIYIGLKHISDRQFVMDVDQLVRLPMPRQWEKMRRHTGVCAADTKREIDFC